MRRVPLLLALVLVLPFAFGIDSVGAYRGWCRIDPQFLIGGQLAIVAIEVQVRDMQAARELSTEPISLVITVPSGTRARHLASGNGFGYGYDVAVEYSPDLNATDQAIPVRVAVFVPMADSAVPVRVFFVPAGVADLDNAGGLGGRQGDLAPGTASGKANDWIVVQT